MNCGDVPLGVDHIQGIKLGVLVFDAVLLQGLLHVQRSSQPLPHVASPVLVVLQVAVQDLADGLLCRHLQDSRVVVDHVHDFDLPGLFGKFSDDVVGVFPPFDLALRLDVQILPRRTVELAQSRAAVYFDPGLSAARVEPVGDVGAGSLDQRGCERVGDVLLDYPGEVVDFPEEGDPAVVGRVVVGDFLEGEVSLLLEGHWQVLLEVILLGLAHKLYNQRTIKLVIQFRNRNYMKINTPAKIARSLFAQDQPEERFPPADHKPPPRRQHIPFKEVNNTLAHKHNRTREWKNKPAKEFISKSDDEEQQQDQLQQKVVQQHGFKSHYAWERAEEETGQLKLRQKPKLLLQLDLEDDIELASPVIFEKQLQKQDSCQAPTESIINNLQKIKSLDISGSSQHEGERSAKIIDDHSPSKQQDKPKPPQDILELQDCPLTAQFLFQKIAPNTTLRCLIRRDKKNHEGITEYNVYFENNLRHVLTIKKESMCQHAFYLRQSKGYSFSYTKVAVLESNFLSSKYTLLKPEEANSRLTVCYETNFLGFNGPRKLHVYLPKGEVPYEYLNDAFQKKKWQQSIEKCVSKSAKWSEKAKSFILSFKGRALKSSIKNFVITDEEESEDKYLIIFGKAAPDVYNLDIESPFSLIQGAAVAISSFQRKITCD